jgi:hypothetical protein
MTTTYMIHAWCMRPFIATIDIEADTPEEAIKKARTERQWLYDTAAECNGRYPWDEFAAHDEDGNELLHVRDDGACLRDAATDLLKALTACANYMSDDLDESDETETRIYRQARAAVERAGAVPTLPEEAATGQPIVSVSVRGGLIDDLEATIPLTVVVEDWDVPNERTGEKATLSVHTLTGWMSGPRAEELARLIAND